MADEKRINDPELEDVVGGDSYILYHIEGVDPVGKYSGVIGEKYYVFENGTYRYFTGVLLASWEKDGIFWTTTRFHRFREPSGEIREVNGDEYTMYKAIKMVKE